MPPSRQSSPRLVNGYPTILFSPTAAYEYDGERTADDLLEFASGGYVISSSSRPLPSPRRWFTPLLNAPDELAEVVVHGAQRPIAAALAAGALVSIGVLLGIAAHWRRAPPFVLVRALTARRRARRFPCRDRAAMAAAPRQLTLEVAAPANAQPGRPSSCRSSSRRLRFRAARRSGGGEPGAAEEEVLATKPNLQRTVCPLRPQHGR